MHKSKLYDIAAQIAMDKLMPKPVQITISMRGGGGLSNLNENIVYRQGGGGFGYTPEDVATMQEWQGYTDPGDTRTDDETAIVRPAGVRVAPRPPGSPRGEGWEPLLPPRRPQRQPDVTETPQKRGWGSPSHPDVWDRLGIWRGMGMSPGAMGGHQKVTLDDFSWGGMGRSPQAYGGINWEKPYYDPQDDVISEEEFMRGVLHTQEHFNKPFYDRVKEGPTQTPDYNTEADVIDKIRAGHQDFLTPKEKEVWDRMQGIIGEDDSYLVEPVSKQVLDKILDPLGGRVDVRNMRDRPRYHMERYRKPGYVRPSKAASGGGISDLNDSININGQPHRLVWANPQEERVLKKMGGSGKKVLGKPAYATDEDYSWDWGPTGGYDYAADTKADPGHTVATGYNIDDDYKPSDATTFGEAYMAKQRGLIPSDTVSRRSIWGDDSIVGSPVGTTEARDALIASGDIDLFKTKEQHSQDAGARRRFINQHLANYPGGRRDPVTQELFSADVDYDRAIDKYGSSMLQTLRDSYAGNQDVFGAMFGHATKLTQDLLREAFNKEINKFPEDFVDSEEYRESIVDAVLSDPNKAFEKFGLTDVTKSKSFLPEAKVGERGWRDWLGELATPMAVRGVQALAGGIPALLNIWGTGKVNGEGVYIKKDGTLIPFTSKTERGNIESGSLRGENVVPKKLKPRPVQVASAEEVVEEKRSPLERFLDARPETTSLDKLYEDMKSRVNPLYNRNIFT